MPAVTSSSRSSAAVSRAPIGTSTHAYTSPVSRPSATCITHTPVTSSPAMIARSTGAAPRHRGSSEKWRLIIGSRAEHVRLDQLAEGDDDSELGIDAEHVVDGVAHVEPERVGGRRAPGWATCRRPGRAADRVWSPPGRRRDRRRRAPPTAAPPSRACRETRASREAEPALARRTDLGVLLQPAVLGQRRLALVGCHPVEHQHTVADGRARAGTTGPRARRPRSRSSRRRGRCRASGPAWGAPSRRTGRGSTSTPRRTPTRPLDSTISGLNTTIGRSSSSHTKTCFCTPIWGAASAMPRSDSYSVSNMSSTSRISLPSTSVTGAAFDLSTGSPYVRIENAT